MASWLPPVARGVASRRRDSRQRAGQARGWVDAVRGPGLLDRFLLRRRVDELEEVDGRGEAEQHRVVERGEVDDRHHLVALDQDVVGTEVAVDELLRLGLQRAGGALEHGEHRSQRTGRFEQRGQRAQQVVDPRHPREDRVPLRQPRGNSDRSQRRVEPAEVPEEAARLSRRRRQGDPPRQQLLHGKPGRRDVRTTRSRQLPGLTDAASVQPPFDDRIELHVRDVPRPLDDVRPQRRPQQKD